MNFIVFLSLLLRISFTLGHPDEGLNVLELISKHGYPYERHSVTTEDGYILEYQRIPHGISNTSEPNKPVVLLMHGFLSSAADWVNSGPGKSLAYILADLGYDVWLGNARGTTWSRAHVTLNPDNDPEFWNFSWEEIGSLDLPVVIDYILALTGQEKLFYVGHSQGCTSFFTLTTMRPEYNDKIRLAVQFGPAVYMDHMTNPFLPDIAKYEQNMTQSALDHELYEFLPSTEFIQWAGIEYCGDNAPSQDFCANMLFLICGFDSQQFNASLLPVIASNSPAGSSIKQFLHFAQSTAYGFFRRWDHHDEIKNIEAYGQPVPPDYDLTLVTAPIAIYYGANDWLVSIEDVQRIIVQVPNLVYEELNSYEKFNHLDFMWANDVVELLYNNVIDLMAQH